MSQFLFVNGQIRALESRLLTPERLERMVGAKSPEDAFRVMAELQYAEYFDDTLKPRDFSRVIQQGLQETKQMVQNGVNNYTGYDIFFEMFDVNNLKQAYRAKFLDRMDTITEEMFQEENGYSTLGDITLAEINEIVFQEKTIEHLSSSYKEVLPMLSSIFEEKKEFRFVEYALDKAYAQSVHAKAKQSKSSFVKNFAQMMIDGLNLRMIARALYLHKEELPAEVFLPHGNISQRDFSSVKDDAQLKHITAQTAFVSVSRNINDDMTDTQKATVFEQGIDEGIMLFLESEASGSIDSPAVSFHYLERRFRDARKLRFVMFAKFQDMEPTLIHDTLKTF